MASTQRQTTIDFVVRKSSRARSKPEPFQLNTKVCWTPRASTKGDGTQTARTRSSKRQRVAGRSMTTFKDLVILNLFLIFLCRWFCQRKKL